jgi:hypothetical protein
MQKWHSIAVPQKKKSSKISKKSIYADFAAAWDVLGKVDGPLQALLTHSGLLDMRPYQL